MQTGSALYCEQKIIVYKTGMCFQLQSYIKLYLENSVIASES